MDNVKVTKRATNDGIRYSVSGLTYNQLFRIKCAAFEEAKKMKGIADEFSDYPVTKQAFDEFADDAKAVFEVLSHYC